MIKELPKIYEPSRVEDNIYKKWKKSGAFNPDNLPGDPYTIMMPPPNVTGVLHLGHALENSLMDIMARFQRMHGKKVLFLPGTDHAAVATQAKVEKVLMEQGIKHPREELGRDKLLEKIREYADNSKKTILKQIEKLGSSCDWSRLSYTFDEARSRAVNEVFKRMYHDGLIYRGYRVVNWSVKGQSTCSDDELVYIERQVKFYTFKYSKDFPIAISTSRPETKLGDTAVAVNPRDKRYKNYIGQIFNVVNFGGAINLKIKIIADDNVDINFGTGAVGVTPAHSTIDFEMFEKQKARNEPIDLIPIIDKAGRMTSKTGSMYENLPVLEAREKVVAWLETNGLIEKIEEIGQNVGTSDRFGDVVEALPMTQWFVDVNRIIPGRNESLKDLMREAVTSGLHGDKKQKIEITPKRFVKNYLSWIDNLRDWCISRQIWWGHRIPVWYKKSEKMIEIKYFVHGTTVDNEQGKSSGNYDAELSTLGVEQSKKLKELIKEEKFDVIFCSNLKRAVASAELVFGDRGIKIIKDKRLRECNYGEMTRDDSEKVEAMGEKAINKPFPNGECYKDVEKRILNFLDDLMKDFPGKKVGIVAHKAPQMALEVIINGKTWERALDEDWRKKKAWQPGWSYQFNELKYVGVETPVGKGWVQDEDTLDTWFSSGLWTFSTLGWPEITADFKTFHPTSWMQMGYEILFFWMARMILMSTYNLDQIPFKDVYIHGMLKSEEGKKFSKSSGNNADPLEVLEKYGTDALRFSLISGIAPGNDTRFYYEKVEGAKNLINKIWNISRYILSNYEVRVDYKIDKKNITEADNWILIKFYGLVKKVSNDLDNYRFSQAGERLREFTWDDFADWYLEVCKFEKTKNKSEILSAILFDLLKIWHPFIPFVTEAIWQEMNMKQMLIYEEWPLSAVEEGFAGRFRFIKDIIIAIRNARSENKVEPAKKIKAVIYAGKHKELIESQAVLIKGLRTGIADLEIKAGGEMIDDAIFISVGGIEIYLIGAFDKEKEKVRLEKEIANLEKMIASLENKLENEEFVAKAPEKIVSQVKVKLEKYRHDLANLKMQLKI